MREIEIKLRIKNLEDLEKKLIAGGLEISKEISQHDTVYTDPRHGNFDNIKEGNVVVRIRRESNVSKITLKQQQTYEMDNLEYETTIGDPEIMHNIFVKMGWLPEVEVKKTRKKGKLGGYEVCLDQVEQLGSFIELEKMTDDNANPDEVRKELFDALRPFGLSEEDEETKGYDTQIYNLKNK